MAPGDIWTIKPFRFDVSGPGVMIENFRLCDLITYAYDVADYELFGEPRWADIAITSLPRRRTE